MNFEKTLQNDKHLLDLERYKDILTKTKDVILSRDFLYFIFFNIVATQGVKILMKFLKKRYIEKYGFDRLDVIKLKKDKLDRYFSYYKYENDDEYPEIHFKEIKVKYTNPQLTLILKLIGLPDTLTEAELVSLELSKTLREAEVYRPVLYPRLITNKGRIVGNLTINNAIPIKFMKIVNLYNRHKDKRPTIVYSNFYEKGILLFSKYLKSLNISHTIYTPFLSIEERNNILSKFKNKKITMLLLHPVFYQGFNIQGCRVFHILDPIISYSSHRQLISRVVRLKSHSHLPIKQRKVNIYQWNCSLMYDINKISHSKAYNHIFNTWSDPMKSYLIPLMNIIHIYMSPDEEIIFENNVKTNFSNDFNKTIEILGEHINNNKLRLNCCVKLPKNISTKCSNPKLITCSKLSKIKKTKNK